MTVNPAQTTPYIETSRKFPQDPALLEGALSKMYVDVASGVNSRVIGIYELASAITGEKWFSTTSPQTKRQTQRKVFQFSDSTLVFNHNLSGVTYFTRIYGTFTDGDQTNLLRNIYPLPYVSPTAANQVGVSVSLTQVTVTKGGGAPAITSGFVILEYLQQ